jgi:hypothetical protein
VSTLADGFGKPTSLRCDESGTLFVADNARGEIVRLHIDPAGVTVARRELVCKLPGVFFIDTTSTGDLIAVTDQFAVHRVSKTGAVGPNITPAWNYEPANQLRFVLPVLVNWVHTAVPGADAITGVPMPPSDAARVRIYWRGCADIEKALNRSNDPGLGGLATDVRIVDRKWIAEPEVGQDVWAQLTLHVHTRREFGKAA